MMERRSPRLPPPSESRLGVSVAGRNALLPRRVRRWHPTFPLTPRSLQSNSVTQFCPQAAPAEVTPAKGCATLCYGTADEADARYLATARADRLPPDPAGTARHAAGQSRLPLQSILRALPRQCRPESHGGNVGRDGRRRPRLPRHEAPGDARHHRRRAGTQPALSQARARGTQYGRARDGSLQSDGPRRAGTGRSRPIPRQRAGRDHRVHAVLSRRQRGSATRQGRVRSFCARPAEAQQAGLRTR